MRATSMMTQTVSTTADHVSRSGDRIIRRIISSSAAQNSGISINRHNAPERIVKGTFLASRVKISRASVASATMGSPSSQNHVAEGVS